MGSLRSRLDPAASLGVPAHVSVLFPFVPPGDVDDAVRSALAGAVATVPAFDVTFARLGWFGQEVVWLAPDPAAPFVALTEAVCREFPEHPPFGGEYDDVVPHLTIGNGQPAEALAQAAQAVQAELPISARVTAVSLMAGSREPGSWRVVAEFPLAGAGSVIPPARAGRG